MIGMRRLSDDQEREALRIARGTRLGGASKDEYGPAVRDTLAALEVI